MLSTNEPETHLSLNYVKVKWFCNKFAPWTKVFLKDLWWFHVKMNKNLVNFSLLKKHSGSKVFQNWWILYGFECSGEMLVDFNEIIQRYFHI